MSWRDKLTREAGKLDVIGKRIDNSDIQAKLLESLRLGNALLTQFIESVLGKNRELLFKKEMEEIDRIAELQANVEQQEQNMKVTAERLVNAKEQLVQLKKKMS